MPDSLDAQNILGKCVSSHIFPLPTSDAIFHNIHVISHWLHDKNSPTGGMHKIKLKDRLVLQELRVQKVYYWKECDMEGSLDWDKDFGLPPHRQWRVTEGCWTGKWLTWKWSLRKVSLVIQCSTGCKEGGCCRKSSKKWPSQGEAVQIMFCEGTCKVKIDRTLSGEIKGQCYFLKHIYLPIIWLRQGLVMECRIFQLWHVNSWLWHVRSGSPVRDWRVLMKQLKGNGECGVLVRGHQGSPQCYSELQLSSSTS